MGVSKVKFVDKMKLVAKLIAIMGEGEKLIVTTLAGGIQLEYGAMYHAPGLQFSQLKALSKLFGTDNINVDNYNIKGCESCDYNSDYGHTIQIRDITKNSDVVHTLVGNDLLRVQKDKVIL